jgi:hypothetical protein
LCHSIHLPSRRALPEAIYLPRASAHVEVKALKCFAAESQHRFTALDKFKHESWE